MNNNYNLNNLTNKTSFNILDIITILGFVAQIDNIKDDEIQTDYIRKVIQAISDEIDKLHKENDVIIEQNNKILKKLEEWKGI